MSEGLNLPDSEQLPMSVRVYNSLVSNGVSCLRDVYEALGEEPSRVGDCLRRLWKKSVVPEFGARAYNPKEKVTVMDRG